MAASFEDYTSALKMRDVIQKMVVEEINKLSPAYRYGTVVSISRMTNRAQIEFPEGGDLASVSMGSIQPLNVGQVVRIAGLTGDRFIEEVYGPVYLNSNPGMIGEIRALAFTTIPSGWLACDGQAISRTDYALLFAAIGTTWGVGDGTTTFNVPDLRGRALIGEGTGTSLTARPIGQIIGQESVALFISEMPSHTHTQNSHVHTHDAHTHVHNAHTHVQDSHTHVQNAHSHGPSSGSFFYAATSSGGSNDLQAIAGSKVLLAPTTTSSVTAVNQSTTATNQSATTTAQTTVSTEQAQTAVNQNTGGGAAHNNMQPSAVVQFIIDSGV